MERSEVAIVIPTYNEEKTVYNVVSEVSGYGLVIVVDDGSADNTRKEAQRAGALVVSHNLNCGYDEALNTGFKTAYEHGCKYVITLDADGQHNPGLIAIYMDYLKNKNCILVLGSRPVKARFSELIMGFYFRWRFGISDILCGMKGYQIGLYAENKGFDHMGSVGTELAFLALKKGYKYVEVPVRIRPRIGNPRFGNIIKSNVRILKALLKTVALDVKLSLYKKQCDCRNE